MRSSGDINGKKYKKAKQVEVPTTSTNFKLAFAMTVLLIILVPVAAAKDLHEPISIYKNSDFVTNGFPGSGTSNDPYRIEDLLIVSNLENGYGIEIKNTTKYFLIKNCLITSDYIGIMIQNVSLGTASIEGNMIKGTKDHGTGIYLQIDDVLVYNNTCTNYNEGILLNYADDCIIINNNLINNTYHGLGLRYSSNNLVGHNQLEGNRGYGVLIIRGSYDNILYNNTFINNSQLESYEWDNIHNFLVSSQARDERRSNQWSDTTLKMGNSWSDYNGSNRYFIDGDGKAADLYPSQVSYSQSSIVEEEDKNEGYIPGFNLVLIGIGLMGYISYRKISK